MRKFQTNVLHWNKQTFGNLFARKRKLLATINGIQQSIHYPTSNFLQNLEIQLHNEFSNILR